MKDQASTLMWGKLPGFKKILAWQRSDELACLIYQATERFGYQNRRLVDQMRSAAVSVPSNIAEGYGRSSLGDYIRHCEIARGSLAELGGQLHHCERVGLLEGEKLERLVNLYGETVFLLNRLIAGLKEKQRKGDWDRSFSVREASGLYNLSIQEGD